MRQPLEGPGSSRARAYNVEIEPAMYPSRTQLILGSMVVPLTVATIPAAGLLVYGALSFVWSAWTRAGGLALAGAVLLALLVRAILYCSGSIPVLQVGADGLLIAVRGAGRFIPYADIRRLARYEAPQGKYRSYGLELHLAAGEPSRIRLDMGVTDRIDAIERQIRNGMDRSRNGRAPPDTELLARGDRPVAAWIQSLRAMGTGANATHRTAPVLPERLWRVLENHHAAPESRAAAAVALAALDSDDARKRLRAAARTAVAPKLRIAIEAAAAEQHDALLEALTAVEAEAQPAPDAARARGRSS